MRDEPGISHDFVAFLSQSYGLKSFADYEDGEPLTAAEACASLDLSGQFVEAIAAVAVA